MSFKKALTLILGHKADSYTKHYLHAEGYLNNINVNQLGKADKREIKQLVNKYFELG